MKCSKTERGGLALFVGRARHAAGCDDEIASRHPHHLTFNLVSGTASHVVPSFLCLAQQEGRGGERGCQGAAHDPRRLTSVADWHARARVCSRRCGRNRMPAHGGVARRRVCGIPVSAGHCATVDKEERWRQGNGDCDKEHTRKTFGPHGILRPRTHPGARCNRRFGGCAHARKAP
jgi:hypothetical protein